jgi:transposase
MRTLQKDQRCGKLHTLLDLRGNIPSFITITDEKVHDVCFMDALISESGAIYVMDKAYMDLKRLYSLHQNAAFFVTRTKTNVRLKGLHSSPENKSTGQRCD